MRLMIRPGCAGGTMRPYLYGPDQCETHGGGRQVRDFGS
jgi:hypothetical protein